MKKNILQIAALALVVFVASSCAKVPQVEVDSAKASVEAAKAVEANRYLAADFNALNDSLNAATVAIETEKSKFFITRDYDAIKNQLIKISADADVLKIKAEERKAQVREEVQQSVVALNQLIVEDKALLAKAPKGKEGKAALEAIQSDITMIEASVNEINTLIGNGDFLTAQDKVKASTVKAESIKEELNNAIAKTKKRK
jgi:endonuclease I